MKPLHVKRLVPIQVKPGIQECPNYLVIIQTDARSIFSLFSSLRVHVFSYTSSILCTHLLHQVANQFIRYVIHFLKPDTAFSHVQF